ncbi:MAG: DUF354 domain-containing protein [Crenarchaeota archaeon]|nr:MAG: DUF354 domain-containing protein [Thermoproteota archaeon]RDJ33379.1 MAG: DUF354 domain-containing protein [Thermoproteota archaeon]RDJ36116.1 MAG: DUF354 domain-containing protein [Thermoproteota archaeon]RDJ38749.1 MAG: DUF354 domain-containing protein [Thermoproteota archaeon]
MKIWFDILTPKQLLFFEPMIKKLRKNHDILCTTRNYNEVTSLAQIRHFPLKVVGRHGGGEKSEKLRASIERMAELSKIIEDYSPNCVVSFCSPEASRISFGLGIYHIVFSDSPHADAVMKLSLPLIQKLLIPWIIPKNEFTKFGIKEKDIIQYRAIDAASISKRVVDNKIKLPYNTSKKTILVRIEEEYAAYSKKNNMIIPLVKALLKKFGDVNLVISCRYQSQVKNLRKNFGNDIKILTMSYDGKQLLENTSVFIGSGGTMTAEAALLGVPTISFNAVPNFIEDYLVRRKLVIRERNPNIIARKSEKLLLNQISKKRARNELVKMEDPFEKLEQIIELRKKQSKKVGKNHSK